jgi:hypothetical protein
MMKNPFDEYAKRALKNRRVCQIKKFFFEELTKMKTGKRMI